MRGVLRKRMKIFISARWAGGKIRGLKGYKRRVGKETRNVLLKERVPEHHLTECIPVRRLDTS